MADVTAWISAVLLLGFPVALIAAAATDLASFTIPNWLSIGLVCGFAALAPLVGLSIRETGLHALAGMAMLGLGFGLFTLKVVGGGDVKLLAASAVWTGWAQLGPFLLLVALAGGVVATTLLIARRIARGSRLEGSSWLGRLLSPKEGVPYGVAIAVAGLFVVPRLPMTQLVRAMWGQ